MATPSPSAGRAPSRGPALLALCTASLMKLPAAVAIGAISLGLSARLNARFGERAMLPTGLALLVAGLGLLTRLPRRESPPAPERVADRPSGASPVTRLEGQVR